MQRSWGFTGTDTALYVGVTGIWNIFVKLALPVLSIAILVLTGQSSTAYVTAAIVGVIVLAVAVGLLAAVFHSEPLARSVGRGLGRVITFFSKPFRRGKGPITGMDDKAAKFRADTIELVQARWVRLTFFTMLSQLALFFVLLLALRHMGISEAEVSTAKVFAVYSFSRLLSAVPITPGGVGVIDLGYVGGLTAGVPESQHAAVVAAVLIFRVLTYGIQIPLGALTYFIWLKNKSWRKAPPDRAGGGDRDRGGGRWGLTDASGGIGGGARRSSLASRSSSRHTSSDGVWPITRRSVSATRAATVSATPAPRNTPPSASENQCAFR